MRDYEIETWISNAGVGNYDSVADQDLNKISMMLNLNIEALTILSSLYVRAYKDVEGTQLINISSCEGCTIVPRAVTYCAAKFYVSTFTEGPARKLEEAGAKMKAKVLAPAATKTEFGMVANNVSEYDYDKSFGTYHTGKQAAGFLLGLYDSEKVVGMVDRESFGFRLADPLFPYAGNSSHSQQCM
ncbi:SDR family NAD(P)-dependent oxidoreductase [Parablautia muri]|uniref:SDR family NAD(P)-dependent oxidoreductase n=1 Tax=Parablautia muri TaxID=2320879 RepID=UPI002ED18AA1